MYFEEEGACMYTRDGSRIYRGGGGNLLGSSAGQVNCGCLQVAVMVICL